MLKIHSIEPFQLLIKPTSGDCNINCEYCFYRRVKEIYPGPDGEHTMSIEVLEQLVNDYLSYNFQISVFSWQGGEPTTAGLDFFREVIDLEKTYGHKGQKVGNAFQTNGLLINDEWAKFLSEYNFLVGISLDGPEDIHNHYRPNTWNRVMNAIDKFKKHSVEYNILSLVTDANIKRGRDIYHFYKYNDISYIQFIPALEWDLNRIKSRPYAFKPEEYGEFLCQIFDEWIKNDVGRISVRLFDDLLNYYLGKSPPSCTFKQRCDSYMVVEYNGDIYPCDFYVYSEWKLGNLMENSLASISNSEPRKKFASRKENFSLNCKSCGWLPFCHSGCQIGRYHPTINNIKNYLCPAYRKFFTYSEPSFRKLAGKLKLVI